MPVTNSNDESRTPAKGRVTRNSLRADTPNPTTNETATPSRPTTRRNSLMVEESTKSTTPVTPRRITRRSASIQSEEDAPVISRSIKEPKQPTILEVDELPVARRTRRSASITSEDGANISTPTKKVPTSKKPTIDVVKEEAEDDEFSRGRPITRSMSSSPANVNSPQKTLKAVVSPLVENEGKGKKITDDAQTPDKNESKSPAKLDSKSPSQNESKKLTPIRSTANTKTPNSLSKLDSSTKENEKVLSMNRSWCYSVSGAASDGKIDKFKVVTPTNSVLTSSLAENKAASSTKRKTPKKIDISSDDESDDNKNAFFDSEAEEVDDYETDDSKNTEELEAYHDEKMQIESKGIELGSEDSESDGDDNNEEEEDDGDGDDDSFIASEEEQELLSYSDDDEHLEDNQKHSKPVMRKKSLKIVDTSSSEDEEPQHKPNPNSETKPIVASELTEERVFFHNRSCNEVEPMDVDVTFDGAIQQPAKLIDTPSNIAEKGSNDGEGTDLANIQSQENEQVEMSVSSSVQKSTAKSPKSSASKTPTKNPETPKTPSSTAKNNTTTIPSTPITAKAARTCTSAEKRKLQESIKQSEPNVDSPNVDALKQTDKTDEKLKSSPVEQKTEKNKSLDKSKDLQESTDEEFSDTDTDESDDEKENESVASGSSDNENNTDTNTEKKKTKFKRVNASELGEKFRDKKLNSLAVAKSQDELDTILSKCNEILRAKKEEKKKHLKLKQQKKEQKKKLAAENNLLENGENLENEKEEQKKKKKKQKFGKKYNPELTEEQNKQQQRAEAIAKGIELLEKKRQRKKEKKLAKLEKLKEQGIEMKQKSKPKAEDISKIKPVSPEPKTQKKKSLLTAFEVKQMMFNEIQIMSSETTPTLKLSSDENRVKADAVAENSTKTENKSSKIKSSKQKTQQLQDLQSSPTTIIKSTTKPAAKEVGENKENEAVNEKKGRFPEEITPVPMVSNKTVKKSKTVTPSTSKTKDALGSEVGLQSRFVEEPVTPEAQRLKLNRGFKEDPITPRPIGFKVTSLMSPGEEYVRGKTKKRKRVEKEYPELSRLPPKTVWSASGSFIVENDSNFIALKSNTPTEFGVSVLNPKRRRVEQTQNDSKLSSFKQSKLYESRTIQREKSQSLLKKLELAGRKKKRSQFK